MGYRGRPKTPRRIGCKPRIMCFKPCGIPMKEIETIELALEELEALRLVDVEGLHQEEAASQMGISRRAFWKDLQSARTKVAFALSTGKGIEILDTTNKNPENAEEDKA